MPQAAVTPLIGGAIGAAHRRGKYLCLPIGTHTLILHFRMTGKVVLEQTPRKRVRLRLSTDRSTVAFVDTRRLGSAWLLKTAAVEGFFDGIPLGEEPWPARRDGAWFAARLAGLRGAIKPGLMRQDRIAGLGNIAASEICHRAKIHPEVRVPALSAADFERIAVASRRFIDHVLAVESGPEIHYVNEGAPTPTPFLVYRRQGAACSCGSTIMRMVQSSRATFFCPTCQRR